VKKQDADVTAADVVKIKVSYYPAGKPGPGVLLMHQCNHDRTTSWKIRRRTRSSPEEFARTQPTRSTSSTRSKIELIETPGGSHRGPVYARSRYPSNLNARTG
jgi:hypothetical protein